MKGQGPGAAARRLGAAVSEAMHDSNRLFVRCAKNVEVGVLTAAAGASLTALSILPTMSTIAQHAAVELGRRSEQWAHDEESLVLASVPGAAFRTAAVMEAMAGISADLGERAVEALFGRGRPVAEQIDAHYREIGRSIAELTEEALDAWPLSQSIREHVKAIRRLGRR